jgi:hypothetical protein
MVPVATGTIRILYTISFELFFDQFRTGYCSSF